MGNRGILHREDGSLGRSRWRHPHWITCSLDFKGRKQTINKPGRYTQLFFLDEAVAFAAGHRPCGECRRDAFRGYIDCWLCAHRPDAARPIRVKEFDRELHRARVTRGTAQIRRAAKLRELPDGVFVTHPNDPSSAWLLWEGALRRWSHAGYTEARFADPNADVIVLTPWPIARVLAAGYRPFVHPTARERA
jgi:hypothetical protein